MAKSGELSVPKSWRYYKSGRVGLAGTTLNRLLRRPAGAAGIAIVLVVVFSAIFADLLATHDPLATEPRNAFAAPSIDHFLGTDNLGRDNFSRIVIGSRTAMLVGLISVSIGCLLGIPIGLYAGFVQGWHDEAVMRMMDAVYAFPAILLALMVIAVLGPGMINTSVAIGVTFIPVFARIVRASTLAVSAQDYIRAAECLGAGTPRVLLRHVLPNTVAPIIVQASLGLAFAIIAEASLSFLGLGTQPPDPSWGLMLQTAQRYLSSNLQTAFYPGVAIVITVLGWNLLGDALRDVLDPRLRRR